MSSSIGVQCTELKHKYDACFNKWYSEKFLKGDTTPDCEELFKDYRACVMVTLKEKGIDKLLAESQKES
ncbi:mitochondrial distribution/morphology family 35/apoptosis, partial [Spinellus fusiger]